MSSRVILRFGVDEEEAACGEDNCAKRWRCMLHGMGRAETPKSFKPRAELVVADGKGTLTCQDYWQEKGEHDGGIRGR